jgi:ceramide glucosyltransferase
VHASIADIWLGVLGLLGVVSLLGTLGMQALGYVATRRRRSGSGTASLAHPAALPPLSVLKPLLGAESALLDNLRAFARQDYPEYELVFGVADPLDPAVPLVHELQSEFPALRMTVVTGGPTCGANPKVANLANLSRFACHEHWLISDADVRPDPDYLRALVAELEDPRVGLVHSLLWSRPVGFIGAVLESFHACSFVLPAIGVASWLGHCCVIGKSMLFRARDLELLGGWSSVADVLAEDYVLGRRFAEHFRVALSTHRLETCLPTRTLAGFFRRHLRWCQMRRRVHLPAYCAEFLAHPSAWCLVLLLSALLAPRTPLATWSLAGAGGALIVRCLADGVLGALVRQSTLTEFKVHRSARGGAGDARLILGRRGDHAAAPLTVRRPDSIEAHQRMARWRHQRRQAREELLRSAQRCSSPTPKLPCRHRIQGEAVSAFSVALRRPRVEGSRAFRAGVGCWVHGWIPCGRRHPRAGCSARSQPAYCTRCHGRSVCGPCAERRAPGATGGMRPRRARDNVFHGAGTEGDERGHRALAAAGCAVARGARHVGRCARAASWRET